MRIRILSVRKRIGPFLISRFRALPHEVIQLCLASAYARLFGRLQFMGIDLIAPDSKIPDLTTHPVVEALRLIQSHDPRRFKRVQRFIRRILLLQGWNIKGRGMYFPSGRICTLKTLAGERSHYSPAIVHGYAFVLIHEATHGLLNNLVFPYNQAIKPRIEKICYAESARFFRVLHLPRPAFTAFLDVLRYGGITGRKVTAYQGNPRDLTVQ